MVLFGRFAAAIGLVAALGVATPAGAHDHEFEALKPGEFVVHEQKVPIRIVLIGFAPGEVNGDDLAAWLPAVQKPVVRYPQFYGLNGRDLGLEYQFKHRIVRKSQQFADRFFAYLGQIGTEGPLTAVQTAYNAQPNHKLDVTAPVLYLDAPSVEKWLADHDESPDRGYTIYFINWYGRRDFRFHVYTKYDEPDPDTGYNFGQNRGSRKMVAWGGTHSRSWFYDFSAGPESWGGNYDLTNSDLDGDGLADYRIPVVWEYGGSGPPEISRPASDLGSDMGLLARFVAIDLLFTSSPLYDPLVTAPAPRGAKVAHVAMFEDDLAGGSLASSGLDFMDKNFARARFRSFQPYYFWKTGLTDTNPIDLGAKQALDIFAGNSVADDCWNAFGTPFAQMFCYFGDHRDDYIPSYRHRDYVGPVFAFNTTEAGLGDQFGLLGFADDNWVDGTQTYEFIFGGDFYRSLGYGFTSTVIHEFGHHIGMSHPHDGWDTELELDFGAGADLYFAWAGDESDTVMHYISLSNGFGHHDRDNMYRWETSGYLNWANALAGDILASPKARKARAALHRADELAERSQRDFREWDYLKSVGAARQAYEELALAAEEIGISTPTLAAARRLLPNAPFKKDGCRPRFPNE